MVLRQVHGLASLTDHTACITSVSTINVCRRDEHYVGSAACLVCVILPRNVVWILSANALKLLPAVWTEEHLVYLDEDVGECRLIVLVFEVLIVFEFLDKVVATVFGYLSATVAIEDGKQRKARDKVDSGDVRVLIALSPALHA